MVLRFLLLVPLYIFTDFWYWIKFIASVTTLWFKRFKKPRRFDLYDYDAEDDPAKCGIVVPKEEIILETPLPEEELYKTADEIFIYGVSSKSESFMVRILRKMNDESEAWIYLKLSDGRSFYLDNISGYQSSTDGKVTAFTCGNLKMYALCAMRRWRITYSGMLKEKKNDNDQELVFVKFTFQWTASSEVYDASSDMDIKLTAKAMAEEKWESAVPPVNELEKFLNSYCQSGVISGLVSVGEESEKELYLFGERMRYLGEAPKCDSNFKLILGVVPQTGLFIHLGRISVPKVIHKLYFGFIVNPSSKIDIIEDGLIISKMKSDSAASEEISVLFKAENDYELRGTTIGKGIIPTNNQSHSDNIDISEIKFKISDYNGFGFMLSGSIFKTDPEMSKETRCKDATQLPKNRPLTISFTEEESHLSELAGGKGSSLGKLTKLSSEMKSEFIVPKGIIVTTEAYKIFMTPEMLEEIEKMKNIAYGNSDGNIQEACKKVQFVLEKTALPKTLEEQIESNLKSVFHRDINKIKFAVRSSATGEDTDQMSAAGQMETFLGVQTLKEIFNAVKKCWASQFGYIAVEYKRQNGQILNTPMAVVIQEMVECESSGVLFTCDPVTNNPSVIVITSNYGLGESVVSGSEEPDTIILQRTTNDLVKVKDIRIGLKERKIVLSDSDSIETSNTTTQEVPEEEQKKCCISEHTAIHLGKLSLKIEKYFKSLRDIEWGIQNNKIFIFQSRPVTTGEYVSDFEIMHEFDGPLRSEDDFFTRCNVGEVMPNAISPLGFEILNKGFTVIFMKQNRRELARNYYNQSKYFSSGLLPFYNHLFLSAIDVLTFQSDNPDSLDSKGMMISIFGRVVNDEDLMEKIKQRKFPHPKSTLKALRFFIWSLFLSRFGLRKMKDKVFEYQMPALKRRKAKEIFNSLLNFYTHTTKVGERHMDCSMASSVWNMYLFSVLFNAKGAIDNDVYSDFAKLLASSSNVESADIPAALQKLVRSISKSINSEKFKGMSVEDAQQWLETTKTEAGVKYSQFIKRHGHRCLNEMDVYSTPWSIDPKPLITILQDMAVCNIEDKCYEEAQISNILPNLKVPLNLKSRLLLKFVLPNCRIGIRGRETCKSMVVKTFDNVRKGYRHLGKAMVAEGFLPDEELVFFLTIVEIRDILETRNPKILSRAKHRRKIFPMLNDFKFPEMSKGRPVPCNEVPAEQVDYEANLTMKGIPVSQGTVKGYARVAHSLKEAASLKPGEILITRSTDIAWSPYFPILGGVVTELGGLISHGAVVSREYGLPCVVGLHGATQLFATGDFVLLDGNRGILQRLCHDEAK